MHEIDFLTIEPLDRITVDGVRYLRLDDTSDTANPFITKQYDFKQGFYRGDFDFISPVTGNVTTGTPEIFGRHRIVAALLDLLRNDNSGCTVLDLGCGTLDIARIIPTEQLRTIRILNVDISGPWTDCDHVSALERGTNNLIDERLLSRNSIINLQYDFNQTRWPFRTASVDYIVANMAFHHILPERKASTIASTYDTLKIGGALILSDLFTKDIAGDRLTEAGLRGPEECSGYSIQISELISSAIIAGYYVDENAMNLAAEKRNHQNKNEVLLSKRNVHGTLAINKAIWFLELRK